MKPKILLKLLLLVLFALYGVVAQAQDNTWASDDKLVSLVAVPVYDPQSQALTSVVVTLSDYTVGAAAIPPTAAPYVYPAFTFPFKASSAISPKQSVVPKTGSSTVTGTMEFISLKSSSTSTFLFINLTYGAGKTAEGSVLKISLVKVGLD
ncbi:MAG: hypothetical protein K0U40_05585 [Betaproteobacteria bacterium]|nr:hypothetical protein [Betaproteobacteria bacterium]